MVAAQRQHRSNIDRTGLAFTPVDDPPKREWMALMAQFERLSVEAANARMVGEFFAGIDTRASLPRLRAIVEDWQPDIIVRESWEFASTLVAELYDVPLARVGLGLAAVEEQSICLTAEAVDRARAAIGLAPDPAGNRLRDAPYLTMVPEPLEDPAVTPPTTTHRFAPGSPAPAPPLTDWWANAAAVARAGAGLALDAEHATRCVLELPSSDTISALAPAVERLLSDASYRRNAGRIAGAADTLPPVDAAVGVLAAISRRHASERSVRAA
jgi:hypothetical protein